MILILNSKDFFILNEIITSEDLKKKDYVLAYQYDDQYLHEEFNPYEIPEMIHHECILEEERMGVRTFGVTNV